MRSLHKSTEEYNQMSSDRVRARLPSNDGKDTMMNKAKKARQVIINSRNVANGANKGLTENVRARNGINLKAKSIVKKREEVFSPSINSAYG